METLNLNDWILSSDIKISTQLTSSNIDAAYHTHTFYEIFYILEGDIIHFVNGKKIALTVGNIVFLRLKDAHSFIREHGDNCKHRDILVDRRLFKDSCDYLSPVLFDNINSPQMPFTTKISMEKMRRLESSLQHIINIPVSNILQKQTLINVLLIDLLRTIAVTEYENQKSLPNWINDLLERFQTSHMIRDGLDTILEPFTFDMSYMCRAFKKYVGMTMTEYLCKTRMNMAAYLLQITNDTILNISNAVGFSSVAYFNKQFKIIFNCTPKEFRKKAKAV